MKPATIVLLRGLVAALAGCVMLGTGSTRAQDVANGLWQDYRYPASNPNWRRNYEREVATWGEHPQGLRPRYTSSPDVVWGSGAAPGTTPFGDQPFYTSGPWNPYVPRPVAWTGLEYSSAGAPPETTTGNHALYGPSSPGPSSFTPREWQQWEMNTPEGQRYREESGLGGPPSARAPGAPRGTAAPRSVPREKSAPRQYFRSPSGKPGSGRWQERDGRDPLEPSDALPRADQDAGRLKQYVLNRSASAASGQAGEPKVIRPQPASRPQTSRFVTPAPEHSGFTQYYMRSTPGKTPRHWEVKSGKPETEP